MKMVTRAFSKTNIAPVQPFHQADAPCETPRKRTSSSAMHFTPSASSDALMDSTPPNTCECAQFTPRSVAHSGYTPTPRCLANYTPRSCQATGSTCSSPPACVERQRQVFMLYGSPLCFDPIDFRAEAEALGEALEAGDVQLKVGAATVDSLTYLLMVAGKQQGLVLHISAHCEKHPEKGIGLVLEDRRGCSHILWQEELDLFLRDKGGLDHLSLLVLNTCHSEELARLFIHHGCPHVICTRHKIHDSTARCFSRQFYRELATNGQTNLLKAYEDTVKALHIDPEPTIKAEAGFFTLYGQRLAQQASLETLCGTGFLLPMRDFVDVSVFLDMRLPARLEQYVEQPELFNTVTRLLTGVQGGKGKRAVLLHGPQGIGKTAFGVEFAHFATAPGRAFSCSPLFLRIRSPSVEAVVTQLEEQLEGMMPIRAASKGCATPMSSGSSPLFSNGVDSPCFDFPEINDILSVQALARRRIKRALQQIESRHRTGRLLLVVDDEGSFLRDSADLRWLLGDLLESTNHLHFLILSREPVYEKLGNVKVLNESKWALNSWEVSNLFLNQIHRQLGAQDLFAPGMQATRPPVGAGRKEIRDFVCQQLCNHPLLHRLEGNPGYVNLVATRVIPGGPDLFELTSMEDLLHLPEEQQASLRPSPYSAGTVDQHQELDLR